MTMLELGAQAPDFRLEAADGSVFQLSDLRGERDVVLVFNRGFT